jgi:hypothetical protein
MKFHSVLTKRTYTDDNGKEQAVWYKAGFLKETPNGGKFLLLYHAPHVTYYLLPQEDQEPSIQLDS